jgi:RimJ/RimL family protein N-acetyltransferase
MHDFAVAQSRSGPTSAAKNNWLPGIDGNRQFTLRDGSVCRIRPIEKGDRQRLQAAFQRLSPNSRRLRFFSVKKALTEAELDFLTNPDGRDHIAYGAVRLDEQGHEVEGLGVARCIRLAPGSDTAELAITVADELQRQGIGGRLLRRLVNAARGQGIRRFRCEVLTENDAMRALAISMGSVSRRLDDGVLEYDCSLPEPELKDDPPVLWVLLSAIEANLALGFDLVDQTAASAVEGYAWYGRVVAGSISSAFLEEIDGITAYDLTAYS